MRTLGEELILGGTLPRDTVRGRALLEQTIAAGDIQADVVLGKLLLYGLGLEQDREKALELFEEAAEAGNGHGLAAYGDELMWRFNNPVRAEECASSDNLEHQRCFPFGGSGSSLIEFMRFQFGGASAA